MQVDRLIDVALVTLHGEEVVGRHHSCVVERRTHEHEFAKVRRNVRHLYPKHWVLRQFATKVSIATLEHGADSCHLATEGRGVLVVVGTLFNKVSLHFVRGYVGIIDAHFVTLRLVEDVITIHELLSRHLILCREVLVAIELIVISLDLLTQEEFEEVSEEIFASVLWRSGVVEHGIGLFGEVDGAIEVAPPCSIGGHVLCRRKLAVRRALWRIELLLLFLLLFGTATRWLGMTLSEAARGQYKE